MHRRIAALAALAPALALAQPPAPGPADARAPVPPLKFESAIPRVAAPEPGPGDWKRVNEEVGRLGGHAGHLKALEGQPPAGAPSKSPEKPAPSGAGHPHKH